MPGQAWSYVYQNLPLFLPLPPQPHQTTRNRVTWRCSDLLYQIYEPLRNTRQRWSGDSIECKKSFRLPGLRRNPYWGSLQLFPKPHSCRGEGSLPSPKTPPPHFVPTSVAWKSKFDIDSSPHCWYQQFELLTSLIRISDINSSNCWYEQFPIALIPIVDIADSNLRRKESSAAVAYVPRFSVCS